MALDAGPAPLDELIAEGKEQALQILRRSVAPEGLVASSAWNHYAALWTRDFAFSTYGALISQDAELVAAVQRSLTSISRLQAENGQLPNAAWYNASGVQYFDFGEAASTDATLLFIIAAGEYLDRVAADSFRDALWPSLEKALAWLRDQDSNQFRLIDSVEGGDWMESSFLRSGKLLYNNVLYVRCLELMARHAPTPHQQAAFDDIYRDIRQRVNRFFWPEADLDYTYFTEWFQRSTTAPASFPHPASPAAYRAAHNPDRRHYLSHVKWGQFVDECDVLANVLAILFEISDPARSRVIANYLFHSDAVHPYPGRTYPRVFAARDCAAMYNEAADKFQDPRWRNLPGQYHNGGVWPFIGGFYVTALVKVGMMAEAEGELARLAAANRLSNAEPWGFHEWIDANTGSPGGAPHQTWSAATFVLASEAVSSRQVPLRNEGLR